MARKDKAGENGRQTNGHSAGDSKSEPLLNGAGTSEEHRDLEVASVLKDEPIRFTSGRDKFAWGLMNAVLDLSIIPNETFYTIFLNDTCNEVKDYLFENFGFNDDTSSWNNETFMKVFKYLIVTIVVGSQYLGVAANFIVDHTAITPTDDSYETLTGKGLEGALEGLNPSQRCIAKAFVYINRFMGLVLSYPALTGSTPDDLAKWTDNSVVRYGVGVPLSVTGIGYYDTMTNPKIIKSGVRFAKFVTCDASSSAKWSVGKLLKAGEVANQVLANCFFRALSASFFIYDVSTRYGASKEDAASIAFPSFLGTIIVTLGSRAIGPIDKYFDKGFEGLTPEDYGHAKVSKTQKFANIFMTLLRAIPTGVLIHRGLSIPPLDEPWSVTDKANVVAAWGTALAVFGHSLYSRHSNARDRSALDYKQEHAFKQAKPPFNAQEHKAEEIFDEISTHYKTKTLDTAATILVAASRWPRMIAFTHFVKTAIIDIFPILPGNLAMNLPNGFVDIFMFSLLIGPPIGENDFLFYKGPVSQVWAFLCAKYGIHQETFSEDVEKAFPRGLATAFWTPKAWYPKEALVKAHESLLTLEF